MAIFSEAPEFSPEFPKASMTPTALVGAASPLWAYFGGVAATGLAWWWMTRFTPQNLEAMFEAAATAPLKAAEMIEETVVEEIAAPLQAAAEAIPAVTSETIEAAEETAPVLGGESAPLGPVAAELIREEAAAEAKTATAPARPRRGPPAGTPDEG